MDTKKKLTVRLTVALLIVCILFFDFYTLRNKPENTPFLIEVQALNNTNNWNFNGDATGWSSTNDSGTNTCGDNGSSTGDVAMTTLDYNGSLSGQTAYSAVTADTKNTAYRAMVYQTITAPGSGSVKVKGNYSNYANSSYWNAADTNWIRLDLYDSGNSTYIASLGCVSFNTNQSWTTTSLTEASVTGGTTYAVRVTMRGMVRDHNNFHSAITLGIDNITVNFAPTGLSASAATGSTDTSLSWTASTAGTGANGLHATNPYKIYRDLSSPVTTFLANTTSNSYTDSSTTGNTTYYYAVTNIDNASVESPLSGESSVLTRPGTPGTPTFTNIADTTLTVNWSSPTGGSPNYKIERAPDSSGSPGTWAQIDTTSNTYYNDSSLSPTTKYWYRIRGYNATGDGNYSGQDSATTKHTVAISLVTNGSVAFGIIALNGTKNTSAGDVNDIETISIDQGPADIDIKSSNFAQGGNVWTLSSSNGNNIVKFEFSKDGNSWTTFTSSDPATFTFDTNVADDSTRDLYLQLTAPSGTDSYLEYGSTVTLIVSAP